MSPDTARYHQASLDVAHKVRALAPYDVARVGADANNMLMVVLDDTCEPTDKEEAATRLRELLNVLAWGRP